MAAKKRSVGGRPSSGRRPGKKGGKGGKGYKGLPPNEPQRISLARAVDLTQRYRKAAPASEHAGFFWLEGIKELISQPNVAGMRYYHGLDDAGNYQLVLVAVDHEGRDIVRVAKGKGTRAARATGDAVLLDQHWKCPPYCDASSPLL